ncbi:MAG: UDP-N-acetylmuramoyl-tripeptide--D-alanyl-D-alanine ligase, partial [bacterium]
YGKTSTKHFLYTLLSSRYLTLMTPGSYNTTMGVCRVVNEQLASEHQVFIVEMAAYGRGEIKEIAGLVHPRIGILTAIGPQHLEWFASIENIMATKYELIEALPPDGVAVFNADDPLCRTLADRTPRLKVLQYGVTSSPERLDLRAEDIQHSAKGLSFALIDASGERISIATRLLGRHNVLNILAAGAVAMELGLSLQEVAAGISGLQPPEHRLQLLNGAAGVTVIDDAYNANPDGAAEALEVLRQFGGRRVLVTPGLVELGILQDHANREFGRRAAAVCDHVVLVGPAQTRPVRAGLDDVAFPSDQVTTVDSLQEAAVVLQRILKPGDTVLFENDLPDIYAES